MSKPEFRSDRFGQNRKDQALALDPIAEQYYREYWDVKNLRDLEGMDDGEYPEADKDKTALHFLDFVGIDKVIDAGSQIILLAQRFRPYDSGDDFALCTHNGTPTTPEYDKYINGMKDVGAYPGVYAFGNVNEDGDGFKEFVLIDFKRFLNQVIEGEIEGERHTDGRSRAGAYFSLKSLWKRNCILKSWGTPWESDTYTDPMDSFDGNAPWE